MNKREFLDLMRQTLSGEVSNQVIEQNITYYDQYISSEPSEEAKIIEMLGDPRLIAKSIIESERAAKQKAKNGAGFHSNDYRNNSYSDEVNSDQNKKQGRKTIYANLNWRQKLLLILIVVILIVLILFVGRVILGILFALWVPILILLLAYILFRRKK